MSDRKPTHGEVEAARLIVGVVVTAVLAWLAWAVPTGVHIIRYGRTTPGLPVIVDFLVFITTILFVTAIGLAVIFGAIYLGHWCLWALTTPPAQPPAGKPAPVEEV